MAKIEAPIQKAILACLQMLGYWCWRNNSGNTIVGKGKDRRMIRMSPSGSPDIIGILPGGRFFGIEVKAPGKKQSPNQVAWEEKSRKFGARYTVVTSVREARDVLAGWNVDERRKSTEP